MLNSFEYVEEEKGKRRKIESEREVIKPINHPVFIMLCFDVNLKGRHRK